MNTALQAAWHCFQPTQHCVSEPPRKKVWFTHASIYVQQTTTCTILEKKKIIQAEIISILLHIFMCVCACACVCVCVYLKNAINTPSSELVSCIKYRYLFQLDKSPSCKVTFIQREHNVTTYTFILVSNSVLSFTYCLYITVIQLVEILIKLLKALKIVFTNDTGKLFRMV